MSWSLILKLSMFGLAMALGTVFFIPSNIEPFCWFAIFLVCAWAIAKQAPGRPFLHGLGTGVMNSVWMTAAHVAFSARYLANHAAEAEMMQNAPVTNTMMMLMIGPIIGVISGCVLGLFAVIARKIARRAPAPATT